MSTKKAINPPKPNTLAAFILSCPTDASDADIAKLARDSGRFPKAQAKNIYHARWYYRDFIRGVDAKPAPKFELKPTATWKDGAIVAPAAPAAPPAPAREITHAQLIAVIKAAGTDAVRAALEAVEQSTQRVA